MHGLERSGAYQFRRLFADCGDGEALLASGADEAPFLAGLPEQLSGEQIAMLCDGVIDLMAALFSVSGRQLRSPKRHGRAIARVRQIGMYIAHTTLGMRMVDVAAGFGRDKSTVIYACHLIEDLRDDSEFDAIVARAEQIVRVAFHLHVLRGSAADD